MLQKRILFKICVDNVIDIITNSSSELFVLKGESKAIVEEMIANVYPNYRNEYEELKHIAELTLDELENFISYHCGSSCWPARKENYLILPGFTFDELYEPEKDWKTGELKSPAWNGEIQYRLKEDFIDENNKEEIINRLDPNRSMYFLFSLDENPDWGMQESLMNIGDRYHLG